MFAKFVVEAYPENNYISVLYKLLYLNKLMISIGQKFDLLKSLLL